ncbi:MAG: hypothetical protein Q4E62_07835, partial [Sutterellaceae bacterium]|nr:hypothetical protein [Sutterellaceae bacterium]
MLVHEHWHLNIETCDRYGKDGRLLLNIFARLFVKNLEAKPEYRLTDPKHAYKELISTFPFLLNYPNIKGLREILDALSYPVEYSSILSYTLSDRGQSFRTGLWYLRNADKKVPSLFPFDVANSWVSAKADEVHLS